MYASIKGSLILRYAYQYHIKDCKCQASGLITVHRTSGKLNVTKPADNIITHNDLSYS